LRKRIVALLVAVVLLAGLNAPANATLASQYTLSQDVTFQGRVRQAIITVAIAVANEAGNTAFHSYRSQLATKVLADPAGWSIKFAEGVSSDSAVSTAAGSPSPVQANVADAQISNAVTGQWNAYGGI
jgi:hypothetical protein